MDKHKHSKALVDEKISKVLLKQSAPAMVGMLVMSLYHIVDTIFVGRGVGALGIAAIAISFPIQLIVIAVSQAVGIGMASILSRSLGAKNLSLAENTLGNFFSLIIIASIIITALGVIFLEPLLKLFGATASILPYAVDYMQIILLGTISFTFVAGSSNIIRAEGKARLAMNLMLIGAFLNIALDPIFIFVLGWGIKGAAAATIIAQTVAAGFALYSFMSRKSGLKLRKKYLKFNKPIISEALSIGASSFARQTSTSVMILLLNHSLGAYGGDLAIAAFGILHKMVLFVFMPLIGLGHGLQPIVGVNYGAQRYDRAKEAIWLALKVATVISSSAFLILMLFPHMLVSIFTTDIRLVELAGNATKIAVLAFPLVGSQILGAGIYQALGKAKPAFVLSILRQVVLFIPLLFVLPRFFGLNGIWGTFPLADGMAAVVTFAMVYQELKLLGGNITSDKAVAESA